MVVWTISAEIGMQCFHALTDEYSVCLWCLYLHVHVSHEHSEVSEVCAGAGGVRSVGSQQPAVLRRPEARHTALRVAPERTVGVETLLWLLKDEEEQTESERKAAKHNRNKNKSPKPLAKHCPKEFNQQSSVLLIIQLQVDDKGKTRWLAEPFYLYFKDNRSNYEITYQDVPVLKWLKHSGVQRL